VWGQPELGLPLRPGGSEWGPVRELGKFYEALLDSQSEHRVDFRTKAAGLPAERCSALLRADTARLLTQRTRTGLFDHTFKHTLDFGLGFIVNSNRYDADTVPYGYGRHASEATFGHSGAQSSCAFADPAHGLVVAWATNGTPGEVRHQHRQREINTAVYEDLGLVGKW
jgi:CubicO group peptidase (beta-lactamase class C family)